MGERGPAPTPTALKVLRGDTRPSRFNPDEPKMEPSLPSPPSHLDKRAKAIWKEMGQRILDVGIITALDEAVFALYCQGQSDIERLTKEIRKQGETFVTESGYIARNPKTTLLREARQETLKSAMQLGLTPSARTRVNSLPKKEPKDPWAKL